MAVFPADHSIRDQASLVAALDLGARWMRRAAVFGPPGSSRSRTWPGPGPSWPRAAIPGTAASSYSAGMFCWQPWRATCRRSIRLVRLSQDASPAALAEVCRNFPNISLDHGIMERVDNVAVVPVEMGWNDVGTWGALQDIFPNNEQGNVILGRTLDRGSKGCTFYAQNRLVATVGLENVIEVDTPDATLVVHRDRVQEVKDLVTDLQRQNMVETVIHLTVERPWGHYTVMEEGPGYKVKQIEVSPGSRLSLQMHQHRAEHWVLVQGTAKVTIGSEVKLVTSNQSVYIPLKTAHRLKNPGKEPLRIIEVQTGAYLGEDDIQRLDDDYFRS
jgi:mannose-1-phosphate guanylyltransferase / mannose-6-phosphate isomerase